MAKLSMTYGVRLRSLFKLAIADGTLDAIEVVPDGYAEHGDLALLQRRTRELGVPVYLHCISGSLASAEFPGPHYLDRVRRTIDALEPVHVSDHLTCMHAHPWNLGMNLPIVANETALQVALDNVGRLAEAIAPVPLLLEHVPTYWKLRASTMEPFEFYARVIRESGIGALVDLHNLYCDERNLGVSAENHLELLPPDAIQEVHLAGGGERRFGEHPPFYVDSHDSVSPARVHELLRFILARYQPYLVNIERETSVRDLSEILEDVRVARAIMDRDKGTDEDDGREDERRAG